MGKQAKKKKPTMADKADRHVLYQASVQCPEAEVEFFDKTFRELRGRDAKSLKEDFCGTALLATEWCKSDLERTAIGVDIDEETLEWGKKNNIKPAGKDVAKRITLIKDDVKNVTKPKVDIVSAFNFSYCLFEQRDELIKYFKQTRKSLKDDGLLILDLFGGTECADVLEEETELDEFDATYIWEHVSFNPINNHMACAIHFEFDDGSRMDKAFTYEWRLWSIPEVLEMLEKAGYAKTRVYWERYEESDDDDDELEGTGEYYETTEVENQESWMIYIVAEPG
ncbi:MAG: class I SAM-dependent methyltransferase [Gammaproteobacteria bacterium]|nr:class I SAM-dependent methyltransferase [Gammaproteobacteria bacterium]